MFPSPTISIVTNILSSPRKKDRFWVSCVCIRGQLEALRKPIFDYIKEKYNRVLPLENETQEGEIYIDTIAVLPEAQGKGIGKKLLQYAIETFVEQQGETLGLLVDKENPSAKKTIPEYGLCCYQTSGYFW